MVLEEIQNALALLVEASRVRVLEEVDSTMDEVKRFIADRPDKASSAFQGVVVALSQSAGRGRQGRSWVSDPGTGVYFSAAFQLGLDQQSRVGLLPLLTGIEIRQRLLKYSPELKLKWPNDLIVETKEGLKKLGGLLLEAAHEVDCVRVTIGVGVNFKKINHPGAISLEELGGIELRLSQLSSIILESTILAVEGLESILIDEFTERYNSSMLFLNQEVSFVDGSQTALKGINRGVNFDGSLLLETSSGTVNLYSGEVHQGIIEK